MNYRITDHLESLCVFKFLYLLFFIRLVSPVNQVIMQGYFAGDGGEVELLTTK